MALITSGEVVDALAKGLPQAGARAYELGGPVAAVEVEPASIVEVATFLRDEPTLRFALWLDICVIDHEPDEGKLHVVYSLRSLERGRVAVKVRVDAADPRVPTLCGVFEGANWAEREAWDMFGVVFEGHPDLRRILMYEEFEGHPLRKSYPYNQRQPLVPERDPINQPWPKRYQGG